MIHTPSRWSQEAPCPVTPDFQSLQLTLEAFVPMLLGRFAAVGRAAVANSARGTAMRGAVACFERTPMAIRSKATVTAPVPLSVRMDGLFAQVFKAAIIYFVPQDLVVLGLGVWIIHTAATNAAPSAKHADPDAAVEEWKSKKGLSDAKVSGGRTYYVSL
mmetsp:Transcript_6377/g.8724  ORF Transcript_6377/g.8724 Transcript_6377/m.8724 type:complete len:160 (+) Transcript_6377:4-483(+)